MWNDLEFVLYKFKIVSFQFGVFFFFLCPLFSLLSIVLLFLLNSTFFTLVKFSFYSTRILINDSFNGTFFSSFLSLLFSIETIWNLTGKFFCRRNHKGYIKSLYPVPHSQMPFLLASSDLSQMSKRIIKIYSCDFPRINRKEKKWNNNHYNNKGSNNKQHQQQQQDHLIPQAELTIKLYQNMILYFSYCLHRHSHKSNTLHSTVIYHSESWLWEVHSTEWQEGKKANTWTKTIRERAHIFFPLPFLSFSLVHSLNWLWIGVALKINRMESITISWQISSLFIIKILQIVRESEKLSIT